MSRNEVGKGGKHCKSGNKRYKGKSTASQEKTGTKESGMTD